MLKTKFRNFIYLGLSVLVFIKVIERS